MHNYSNEYNCFEIIIVSIKYLINITHQEQNLVKQGVLLKKGPHMYYILITIETSALCKLVANKFILWLMQ